MHFYCVIPKYSTFLKKYSFQTSILLVYSISHSIIMAINISRGIDFGTNKMKSNTWKSIAQLVEAIMCWNSRD